MFDARRWVLLRTKGEGGWRERKREGEGGRRGGRELERETGLMDVFKDGLLWSLIMENRRKKEGGRERRRVGWADGGRQERSVTIDILRLWIKLMWGPGVYVSVDVTWITWCITWCWRHQLTRWQWTARTEYRYVYIYTMHYSMEVTNWVEVYVYMCDALLDADATSQLDVNGRHELNTGHIHLKTLIEMAMVLSTNSGSFPSNSHVSATFSILLSFGEFWNPTNCEKFNADGSLMGRTNLNKSVW